MLTLLAVDLEQGELGCGSRHALVGADVAITSKRSRLNESVVPQMYTGQPKGENCIKKGMIGAQPC